MKAGPVIPAKQHLLLVGGGHAHVGVIKAFAMKPLAGVRISLITRDLHTPYSGMLPGLIAGHYRFDETHIDLARLCRHASVALIHDSVTGLNPDARCVEFAERPDLHYDLISINIGSRPKLTAIPGAARHTLPIKPIDAFLRGWEQIAQRATSTTTQDDFTLTVIGAGAGGVEIALAAQRRLEQLRHGAAARKTLEAGTGRKLRVRLVGADERIMPTHNLGVQRRFLSLLKQRDIELILDDPVTAAHADWIETRSGKQLPSSATITTTQASAPDWIAASGLASDAAGFIEVNRLLQSSSHDTVFAAGDIASMIGQPREKSGVFAVRQGMPLADNLRRSLTNRPLKPYRAQRDFLGLISTGDQYAVASRGNWSIQGRWLWTAKDWIDRRFMRQFNELPAMHESQFSAAGQAAPDADAETPMRCGGCGSKIGASVLSRVLSRLHRSRPNGGDGVKIGLDSPDDAAVIEVPDGMLLVQSTDFFRAFIDDPYLLGQIATEHALNDLYAMGARPQSALATANVPFAASALVEESLFQLMAGCVQRLEAADAVLVGGHSAEAAELAIGLTVNGFAQSNQLWQKGGLETGDALVLTKAVGTGTILAADMRGTAKGRWLRAALDNMLLSNKTAMTIAAAFDVHACTDLTGFGLAGHIAELSQAAGLGVNLYLERIPTIPGTRECLENGVRSTLDPENRAIRCVLSDRGGYSSPADPQSDEKAWRWDLLFDPQTSGGLIFSLKANQAEEFIDSLKKSGYIDACIIGRVNDPSQHSAEICLL